MTDQIADLYREREATACRPASSRLPWEMTEGIPMVCFIDANGHELSLSYGGLHAIDRLPPPEDRTLLLTFSGYFVTITLRKAQADVLELRKGFQRHKVAEIRHGEECFVLVEAMKNQA